MMLTRQRDTRFKNLLEHTFPDGIEPEKLQTMKEARLAVRAQIFRFACNEKFHILCRCEACAEDRYLEVWDIAEALSTRTSFNCACGHGSFVPVYRDRETTQNRLVG